MYLFAKFLKVEQLIKSTGVNNDLQICKAM